MNSERETGAGRERGCGGWWLATHALTSLMRVGVTGMGREEPLMSRDPGDRASWTGAEMTLFYYHLTQGKQWWKNPSTHYQHFQLHGSACVVSWIHRLPPAEEPEPGASSLGAGSVTHFCLGLILGLMLLVLGLVC